MLLTAFSCARKCSTSGSITRTERARTAARGARFSLHTSLSSISPRCLRALASETTVWSVFILSLTLNSLKRFSQLCYTTISHDVITQSQGTRMYFVLHVPRDSIEDTLCTVRLLLAPERKAFLEIFISMRLLV